MARTIRRTAAFTALGRALTSGARGGPPLRRRLAAVPRLIRASMRGEYDGGKRLAMVAAGLVYVVSPIDLVPEGLLLLVGLADDAVMVAWLAGAVLSETERFLEWERRSAAVVAGQVLEEPARPRGRSRR